MRQIMTGMTIGRVAKDAGVGVETVRFYERKGLLSQPDRQSRGYRQYPEQTVARVRFIKRAQALGFSLAEIQELMDLRDDPGADRSDVRDRAEMKIAQVEAKLKDLQKLRDNLRQLIEQCHGHGPAANCPIIQSLS
jgi:MerR family mercuric resistance operon transcriptional regulator